MPMALSRNMQRIYEKASRILLEDAPAHDALERVGLLTLIAGIRTVALFLGIKETDLPYSQATRG
jgi:hypothetical protein